MAIPIAPWGLRDPVSSVTHLAMAVLALYVTAVMIRLAGDDRVKKISLAVFGGSMIFLYAASGIYHALPLDASSPTLIAFRRLDHSGIYILIAGSYTPVLAVLLRGKLRGLLLIVMWALAIAGIIVKWITPIATNPLTIGLYLAVGWMGLVPLVPLVRAAGWKNMLGLGMGGGLIYSLGAACEILRWPTPIPGIIGPHEVFHVCDMLGTTFHIVLMFVCILPFDSAHDAISIDPELGPGEPSAQPVEADLVAETSSVP